MRTTCVTNPCICNNDYFFFLQKDNMIRCANDYISSSTGSTQCTPCPASSPHSALTNTYCMPSDTPLSVQYLNVNSIQSLVSLPNTTNYFTQEIDFSLTEKFKILILADYKQPAQYMNAYVSFHSGAPTKQVNDYASSGLSITVPIVRDEGSYYKPMYMSVEAKMRTATIVEGVTFPIFYDRQFISEEEDFTLGKTQFGGYIFFETRKAFEQGVRVNITAATYGKNADCRQTLYYCEDAPSEPYPTEYTIHNFQSTGLRSCKVAVQEKGAQTASTQYTTEPRKSKGKLYFAVYPYCTFSATPLMMHLSTSIAK